MTFEVYPANQLGRDYLTLVNSGVADMAMIVTSYAPDKFPLSAVTELPGLYETSCDAVGKFWNIAQDGGKLDENEYKPLGLKAVFLVTTVLGVTGLLPAILADTGATVLVTANAMRLLGWRGIRDG